MKWDLSGFFFLALRRGQGALMSNGGLGPMGQVPPKPNKHLGLPQTIKLSSATQTKVTSSTTQPSAQNQRVPTPQEQDMRERGPP